MKIPVFCRGALLCFWLSSFFVVSFCSVDHRTVEVIGVGECADCKQKSKSSDAVSGLRVSIDCKSSNGLFKTKGVGKLDEGGSFKVALPNEIVEDGKLKEDCFAQLYSASAAPCPAINGLDSSKIIFKSKTGEKHIFEPAEKLQFSPVTCTSAFLWPYFKHPPAKVFLKPLPPPLPIFKKPLHPFLKKPLPPPIPIIKKHLPPLIPKQPPLGPPVPVYEKPLPPPVPIYKKPLPPPTPIFKKPPSPTYVPKKPLPPPVPIYKKPLPPVFPKKPLPPPVPIFTKPLPPSIPKKPYPPTIPTFKKPLPPHFPFYKPKPPFFKHTFPKLFPPKVPFFKKPFPPPIPFFKPIPPFP